MFKEKIFIMIYKQKMIYLLVLKTVDFMPHFSQDSIEIDLTGYASGVYYAILVCNGVVVDNKTLIIE